MAYIFDPIQGTFIDDKDKTLGNKLMLADLVDDLEPGPLKDEMQEDFDPSQETYEEYLQRKRLGDRPFLMADGGRVNLQSGTNIKTLNPLFPERNVDFMSDEFQPIDVPGAIIPPLAIGAAAKRLRDTFFSKDEDKKEGATKKKKEEP